MAQHDYSTEEKLCRICFEDGKREGLISPCVCSGSGRYVHNTCLLRWLNTEPERGRSCTVCLEELATSTFTSIETIQKGPKVFGELRYFDTLCQVGISSCQLYLLIWLIHFYKAPNHMIDQISGRIILGNQTVFLVFGLKPWSIRNKKAYLRLLSETNESWYVVFLYALTLVACFHTPWGGILAVNLISTQVLAYHHSLLEQINKNIGVAFVNRVTQ